MDVLYLFVARRNFNPARVTHLISSPSWITIEREGWSDVGG